MASGGADLPAPPSLQRWDVDRLFSPDSNAAASVYTCFGSYLSCVDSFDAACFRLSPAEAIPLDPHARLLLENMQVCPSSLLVTLNTGSTAKVLAQCKLKCCKKSQT